MLSTLREETVEGSCIEDMVTPLIGLLARLMIESSGMLENILALVKPVSCLFEC